MSASSAGPESNADGASDSPEVEAQPTGADATDRNPTVTDGEPVGVDLVDDAESTLRDQVAALEARLRTVSAAYQAQQKEMAETRARLERQAAVKEQMRRGEVVAELFEPVENLRRSLEAVSSTAGEDAVRGLEIVLQQFMDGFKKLGLEEIPGRGAAFDPNLHEALSVLPVTDPALDDRVIEVFSSGYRIGTRLIRPARVVIGHYQEPAGEA